MPDIGRDGMASAKDYIEQLKALFTNMDRRQQLIAGGVVLFVLAGFAALVFFTNRVDYATLYSDIDQADAADIVKWLKDENIPYRLAHGGTTVQVPAEKVYDIRLALAGAGLPSGKTPGFSLFDKTNLGATDFVQRVNYQRALQGELEKTIERFPQVKSARVHVASPKESLFVSERQPVTASVVLTLKRGTEMSPEQVKSIVHLVASAVPRLHKEHISVVDTSGNVLYEYRDKSLPDQAAMTSAQLVYQRRLEEYYKHKISTMLEDALGQGKAVVQVSADIDFDHTEVNEERFDPDTIAIRSEQISEQKEYDKNAGGIPGVKGGLANKLQGNLTGAEDKNVISKKKDETRNYEVSRVQRQTRAALGRLKRLSVGVLVDGTYTEKDGKKVYTPRAPEEMAKLQNIVRAAMGFSEDRGDDLSVQNVPFTKTVTSAATLPQILDVGVKVLKPVSNLLLAILFIFLVLRPLLNKYVLAEKEKEPGEEEAPGMLEGDLLAEAETPIPFEPTPDATQELRDLANDYPERAAALIKVWLREKGGGEDAGNK